MKKIKIPYYRYKKIATDRYLLTFDNGAWIILTDNEFLEVYSENVSENLYMKLKNKNILVDNNKAIDLYVKKYLNMNWSRYTGNSLHIVIPTLRCNYTCKYCYALRRNENESGYDMSLETAEKVLDFIFQTPADHIAIEFSGGEPLLNFPVIKYIVENAELRKRKYNKSISFALVTNGSLLDEEKFEFLRKYAVGICFSFDGNKDLHNFHRKMTCNPQFSSYDDVVNKIKWLKYEKKYPFVFSIPVITKKSFEYWKEIIDEHVKLGLDFYRFKFLSYFGFASHKKIWSEIGYTPEEFIKYWKLTLDYLIELNKKGILLRENIANIMLAKLFKERAPGFAELEIPCGATIGQIVYNYDGSIYPCDEARIFPNFKIGDVYNSNYVDVINHPITRSMINASTMVETCYNCIYYPFCGSCPLEDYNKEGSFIINVPNSYRCRIYKSMFDYLFEILANDDEKSKILKKWIGVSEDEKYEKNG